MQLRPRDHVAAEREQIAKLAVMRDHGIVSDEEFAAAKAELLAKIVLAPRLIANLRARVIFHAVAVMQAFVIPVTMVTGIRVGVCRSR